LFGVFDEDGINATKAPVYERCEKSHDESREE
jgi:hypothetical protein